MIIIGFVLHFFCIYIDEDQDSPSSQADTAEGGWVMFYVTLSCENAFKYATCYRVLYMYTCSIETFLFPLCSIIFFLCRCSGKT